ncbi:MAG: hypothetical protein J5I52_04595 [Saprospiraceae bacterium]|nr:MAG: hypothetical protein UZ09_BCD002000673 [Bacteroidetes bacterium OLB9]MCO6463409.1 hypothetical protein [Saprospiraceae bacterium]MCZ2338144.1 hypothetical protein [Chitinophagales bacterium]
MKKPIWALIGFLAFFIGLLSAILSLVGLNLTFMKFVYNKGIITVLIHLALIFGGIMTLFIATASRSEEEAD